MCGDAEAHLPGETGCTRIGAACPTGDLPEGLPADTPILHVLRGATSGDGTRAAPFGSVREGLMAASSGTVVAVGVGTYDEVVSLRAGVTLTGACTARTRLTSTAPSDFTGAVTVRGLEAELTDLSVGPAPRPGVTLSGGVSAHLRGVVISGATGGGLAVLDGAELTAEDVVVRDTRPSSGGLFGRGMDLQGRGAATLTRIAFERNHDLGLFVTDAGTRLELRDAVIRDTRAQVADESAGRGISVQTGATVEAERLVLERNLELGAFAGDTGASLRADLLVIRDTRSQSSDGFSGRGLGVENGAAVTLTRAFLERNQDIAIHASGPGTTVDLTDIAVLDTMGRSADGDRGRGLQAQMGADLRLTRGRFERCHDVGVNLSGASARLEDLVIEETFSREADGVLGFGLNAHNAAAVQVARCWLQGNRTAGVVAAHEETNLAIEDCVIRDTLGREADGRLGHGLVVGLGATATVARAEIEDSRELGMYAHGPGTSLSAEDLRISRVSPSECVGSCPTTLAGVGAGAYTGGVVRLDRFVIADAALCGLHVHSEGGLDARRGDVLGCEIGACVQSADYDISRLTSEVRYLDNGTNLDATMLPVPDATPPVLD